VTCFFNDFDSRKATFGNKTSETKCIISLSALCSNDELIKIDKMNKSIENKQAQTQRLVPVAALD